MMTAKSPVILIFGAGPNIGQAVARTFASKGYKVALAARSLREADSTDNLLNIKSDVANPDDVVTTFTKVKEVFGIPSVVVYNGKLYILWEYLHAISQDLVSASTLTPAGDPFALPLSAFNHDTAINVTSAFIAAQQAALGFSQLSDSASKTFIYTGNILNVAIIPSFLDQGMGKAAGAHMIRAAAAAYKDRGYK